MLVFKFTLRRSYSGQQDEILRIVESCDVVYDAKIEGRDIKVRTSDIGPKPPAEVSRVLNGAGFECSEGGFLGLDAQEW